MTLRIKYVKEKGHFSGKFQGILMEIHLPDMALQVIFCGPLMTSELAQVVGISFLGFAFHCKGSV